jgi:DNA repair exonuclease SbcCD nuclease subunit
MKKILRVGDPHIQIGNLSESEKLMDFVLKTAYDEGAQQIEFMGDGFHNHAVVRVEILAFWKKWLQEMVKNFKVVYLVGNHDMQGSKEAEGLHALLPFSIEGLTVVDSVRKIDNIVYAPYYSDHAKYVTDINEKFGGSKTLIAHQTFTGSQYENGFYAPDGIDPALLDVDCIISGHIHKRQKVGKCIYIGTPKWDSVSDANEKKGIELFTHNEDGSIAEAKFISTEKIVTPISKIILNEGDEEAELPTGRIYLELNGKTAWITKMKKKYKGKANIKAKPTDRISLVDKSDKVSKEDIFSFMESYFDTVNGLEKKEIKEYLGSLN